MIFFIDFGLLCSIYCKKYLTYLLKSTEVIQIWEFDNLHTTHMCKDNSWIHGKCRQRFFIQRLQTFFFIIVSMFLRFFLIFISTFITCMLYCRTFSLRSLLLDRVPFNGVRDFVSKQICYYCVGYGRCNAPTVFDDVNGRGTINFRSEPKIIENSY